MSYDVVADASYYYRGSQRKSAPPQYDEVALVSLSNTNDGISRIANLQKCFHGKTSLVTAFLVVLENLSSWREFTCHLGVDRACLHNF